MSNLLEKASILTTATAYNDGKLLSVKPAPYLGSELVTNGTFDTDSNWNKQTTNWTIVNGYAVCDGLQTSNSSLFQDLAVVNGSSYRIDFTITNSLNNLNLILGATTIGQYGSGTHSVYVTKDSNASARIFFQATASNNFSGSLDNVSVKEVIDGDFDFTRNSSATRVNENGLIEDVQILSGNLVTNGDFSQEGAELVTNGDFATDSDWTVVGLATISNGVVSFVDNGTNSNTYISQNVFTVGKFYKVTFDITRYVSGRIQLQVNDIYSVDISGGVGTYTTYVKSDNVRLLIKRNGSYANFDFDIDNVSVKEVGQDWTLGSGWSIGDGKAVFSDTANGDIRTSSNVFTANSKYKINLTVSDLTSGTAFFGIGAGAASNLVNYDNYTNGDYSFEVTAPNGLELRIYATTSSGSSFSIGNISVIEITDDTNLPRIDYDGFSYQDALGSELVTNGDFASDTAWSKVNSTISGGLGNLDGDGQVSLLYQNILTDTKTYTATFTVSNYNGLGSAEVIDSSGSAIYTMTSNGTFTFTFTHSDASGAFLFRARSGAVYSVDNVSVKEYLGQEVVPDSGVGHILLEPQSTNLVTYSEDFSQSYWTKQNSAAITSNLISSPDGTINADLLNCPTTSRIVASTINVPNGIDYTFSIFIKKGTSSLFSIDLYSNGSNTLIYNFDTNVVSGGITDNSIENYGNGWYRLSGTITTASTTLFYFIYGNGGYSESEGSTYIWGAQSEQLSFLTSYIPTSGSTVTRLGETLNNSGSSDLINSTEGVLYAEIAALASDNIKKGISISNGTTQNRVILRYGNQTNKIEYIVVSGGAIQINVNIFTFNILNYLKIAVKWKLNDFALWINGTEVRTDTIGITFPTDTLSELNLDSTTLEPFYGKVKCVAVYKEALTDEELTCLTTI